MDQLRVALRWLKEQHFWVLTVLAVIVVIVCWHMSSKALQEEFEKNKRQILAEFNSMNSLQQRPFHPNEESINKRQLEEIEELRASVGKEWQALYERQRTEVLKWPKEIPGGFQEYIQDKSFGDSIRGDMRNNYFNYAKNHFEELPKIVNARKLEAGTSGSYSDRSSRRGRGAYSPGLGGPDGVDRYTPGAQDDEAEDEDYLVIWHDQGRVRDQLVWDRQPSNWLIWVTQEDLWVYETLLRAIANTNKEKGSDRYSNAAIRDILALEVGQLASRESRREGRIVMPQAGATTGGPEYSRDMGVGAVGGGPTYERDMGPGVGGGGVVPQGGEMTDQQEMMSLLAQRYIGPDGMPLPASADGGASFGVEFKRLPVHMSLYMDQRWLPYLIAECANAPLQVEIQEVRINPSAQGDSSGRYRPSRDRGPFAGGGGGGSQQVLTFDPQPNLATVEIQGTVYIFNKPNSNILQVATTGN